MHSKRDNLIYARLKDSYVTEENDSDAVHPVIKKVSGNRAASTVKPC